MATHIETPLSCGLGLLEDGIKEYSDLIANKDALIRFLKCMVENDRLEYFCENNIQDFFENIINHEKLFSEKNSNYDKDEAYYKQLAA